jgi:DNA-binding transcriptional ArsR family regulator
LIISFVASEAVERAGIELAALRWRRKHISRDGTRLAYMRGGRTIDRSLDTALRVLGAGPRRRVLRFLLDESGGIDVTELADRLHHRSEPTARSSTPDNGAERSRLDRHIGLIHVHLPLLERAGVVEFDRRRRIVAATEAARALGPLLVAAGAFERSNAPRG